MSKKHKKKRAEPRVRPLKLVPDTHAVLHGVATYGNTYDPALVELGERMAATARKHNGLAVAAPQVGIAVRLVALRDGRLVVNPEIAAASPEMKWADEGCLTYPDRWWSVERHEWVSITGFDPASGATIEVTADGIDARMWQHEIDHLDGKVLANRFVEVSYAHRIARLNNFDLASAKRMGRDELRAAGFVVEEPM